MMICVFEVHADPICAVTTNCLNMPFSKVFSVRWPNHRSAVFFFLKPLF